MANQEKAQASGMRTWTVITVTYNSARHLQSHWFDARANLADIDWIVVDNASSDHSTKLASELGAEVIHAGANHGFATANNLGLKATRTPYVAFVNPDVRIAADGWQHQLASTIEHIDGLVGPQLLNPDGSEQPNARGLPFVSSKIRNRVSPTSKKGEAYAQAGFERPTYCAWLMGAAVAGRTEDLRRIGGWDEQYFLYYEDHELGLRSWRAGMPVVLDPDVRWTHEWQRETASLKASAWRSELGSMRTFYGSHPELIDRRIGRRRRLRRYRGLYERLWTPVLGLGARAGQERSGR